MIDKLRSQADNFGVRKIADYMLDDPRFPLWSGSPHVQQHHHGTGGLITHVSEVVNMCLLIREIHYPNINAKVLFLSALLHDWGKLWDFEPVQLDSGEIIEHCEALPLKDIDDGTTWQGTTHKRNIHHISRSAMEWSKAVALSGECKDIEDQVSHAILAHHGQREWGSPVAPNTPIAWLLHGCDMISARMNDCEKIDYLKISRR